MKGLRVGWKGQTFTDLPLRPYSRWLFVGSGRRRRL